MILKIRVPATPSVPLLSVGALTLLQFIVNPALPSIQQGLQASTAGTAWTLIVWLISSAVATPVIAKLGDTRSRSHLLAMSLASVALGGLIAATAMEIEQVIAGRLLQGLGGAIFPLAYALLHEQASIKPSTVGGSITVMTAVGGLLGSALSGWLIGLYGWRSVFWGTSALIGLLAVGAIQLKTDQKAQSKTRLDLRGPILLAAWLVPLLLGLVFGPDWGWTSITTLCTLGSAASLAILWIAAERNSTSPTIDLRLMRHPSVWRASSLTFLFGLISFAFWVCLPMLLQAPATNGVGLGATVGAISLWMLPTLIAMSISGFLSGKLSARHPPKHQLILASAMMIVTWLLLGHLQQSRWLLAIATTLFGLSLGIAYSAPVSVIVNILPQQLVSSGTGTNSNIRTIGGAVGTAIMASLLATPSNHLALSAEGLTLGCWLMAGLATFALAITASIKKQ